MARTFKGLYPQIYDFDNLWLAWRKARQGGKRDVKMRSTKDTKGTKGFLCVPW